jgi:hypothetical protein
MSSPAHSWSADDDRNAFIRTFYYWMNSQDRSVKVEPFFADGLQVELFGLGGSAQSIFGKVAGLKALFNFQQLGSGLGAPPARDNVLSLPNRMVYATKARLPHGSDRGVLGAYLHDLVFDFRLSSEFATEAWPPFAVTFVAAVEA